MLLPSRKTATEHGHRMLSQTLLASCVHMGSSLNWSHLFISFLRVMYDSGDLKRG